MRAGWDAMAFVAAALPVGVEFALTVSSVTAVALGSVPPLLACGAGATTMLRDPRFALGPVVIGAVALSSAGAHPAMPEKPGKATGQCPFAAGSKMATHSTWCVIGKHVTEDDCDVTAGQGAIFSTDEGPFGRPERQTSVTADHRRVLTVSDRSSRSGRRSANGWPSYRTA